MSIVARIRTGIEYATRRRMYLSIGLGVIFAADPEQYADLGSPHRIAARPWRRGPSGRAPLNPG